MSCRSSPPGRARLIETESPFPVLWPLLANDLSRRTYARNAIDWVDPEWRYQNTLLLMGFFATCQLPAAHHVRHVFGEADKKPLSLRGLFFRIPEFVGDSALAETPIRTTTRTGGVTLSCEALFPLIAATAEESRKIPAGNGVLHEIMPIRSDSEVPFSQWGIATTSQLQQGRDAAYRLYEYTLLTYLTLGSIEQILRAWAQQKGQPHMDSPTVPGDVLKAVTPLVGPATLTALRELYDNNATNIRHRIMHGNLYEVESKRLESAMPAISPAAFGSLATVPDPISPENIAQFCLECLETLDRDRVAQGVTLTPADLAWAPGLALTHDEIEFGHRLSADFLEDDREMWVAQMRNTLNALFPGLTQVWFLGFIGWLRNPFNPSLPRFMALGFSFEAIYRSTVHLLGLEILQRSRPRARKVLKTQYRMLEQRPSSIANPAVLARLVRHIPERDRATATQVLQLAIKAHNALAHGAMTAYDSFTSEGLGHIFVKASQTLVTAALHHLVSERAYYRYLNRKVGDGSAVEDWLLAEVEITRWIRALGS